MRYRGVFAYVDGVLADGTTCRYAGCATPAQPTSGASRSTWPATTATKTPSYPTAPAGTAEEALDCACGLYLNDPTAWPTPDELTARTTKSVDKCTYCRPFGASPCVRIDSSAFGDVP